MTAANVRKAITRLPTRPSTARRIDDRASTRPRTRRRRADLPRYLTQDELTRFLHAVRAGGSSRDLSLFGVMYRYGLRVTEATMLLRHDLEISRRRISIRRAKGGIAKEYPLAADLVPILKRYLRQRIDRGPYLFTGREGTNQRGIDQVTIRQLFKRYAHAAGLPSDVSSHSLRHSIAVHSLMEGLGLAHVADLLGHNNLRSTLQYTKIVDPGREQMIPRLDKSKEIVSWR